MSTQCATAIGCGLEPLIARGFARRVGVAISLDVLLLICLGLLITRCRFAVSCVR